MPARKEKSGFTLIELMVVIAIMAVLAVVGFASYSIALGKARDAKRRADLHDIRNALESYYVRNNAYPSTGGVGWYSSEPGDLVSNNSGNWIPGLAPNFIKTLPRDPKGGLGNPATITICGSSSWRQAYLYRSDDGRSYALLAHCSMEAENWGSNDPLIDSVRPTWALKVCDGPPGCSY